MAFIISFNYYPTYKIQEPACSDLMRRPTQGYHEGKTPLLLSNRNILYVISVTYRRKMVEDVVFNERAGQPEFA